MASISDILSGKAKIVKQSDKLSIDYPKAGEKVNRGHYAIRISTTSAECQVAIDKSDWQPCRQADGCFWFDWSAEQAGAHRIAAQARIGNKWVKTERVCNVV